MKNKQITRKRKTWRKGERQRDKQTNKWRGKATEMKDALNVHIHSGMFIASGHDCDVFSCRFLDAAVVVIVLSTSSLAAFHQFHFLNGCVCVCASVLKFDRILFLFLFLFLYRLSFDVCIHGIIRNIR